MLHTIPEVPRLRVPAIVPAVGGALTTSQRAGFRVVHLSIQHNHLHLIVEADGDAERRTGMQYLTTVLARAINATTARRGSVFEQRYHATPMVNPTQTRNTLAYVLCNWRHHDEDRACAAACAATFDPYASALRFDGWTYAPTGFDPRFPVAAPRTWLLRDGWKLVGRVDPLQRPGDSAACSSRSMSMASPSSRAGSVSSTIR